MAIRAPERSSFSLFQRLSGNSVLSDPKLTNIASIVSAALSAVSIAGCGAVDFERSGRYLDGGRRVGVSGGEDAGKTPGVNGNGGRDAQHVNGADAHGADAHGVDAHPEDRDGSTGIADAGGSFDAGGKDAGGNIDTTDAGGKLDAGEADSDGGDAGRRVDAGEEQDAGGTPDAGDLRTPCERGIVSCDDGNACTVGERCAPLAEGADGNGCVAGISIEISDGINCTRDGCNPETGAISHTPINGNCPEVVCRTVVCDPREGCTYTNVANSTPCDIQAGRDEVCFDGTCVPACDDNGDCNDFASCTTDTCNLAAGHCEFTADDTACDDSLFCNGEEKCNPADEEANPLTGCAPADRIPICSDDEKTCTQELCDVERDHCVTTPLNERCDDRDPCTGVEICDPETGAADTGCTNPPNVDCSDLNTQCRVGTCDSESGLCEQVGRLNGTPCNDDLFCNVGEVCQDGDCRVGEARNCSDENLCTADSCEEGIDLCVNTPVDCSELNTQCTDGVCNPETGNCEEQNKPNGADCSDDRYCTTPDSCQNGVCQSGPDRDCADAVACTIDTCSNELTRCIHTADDSRCPDTDEACKVGICLPETGECGVANVPDGSLCNDGIDCTVNDQCQTGTCIGQNPPEIAGNRVDDNCNVWIDESPEGYDAMCDETGGSASITPNGRPMYACSPGGEFLRPEMVSIPADVVSSAVYNTRFGADGQRRAVLVTLVPGGAPGFNNISAQNTVIGFGLSVGSTACPADLPVAPVGRETRCYRSPDGPGGIDSPIRFNITP